MLLVLILGLTVVSVSGNNLKAKLLGQSWDDVISVGGMHIGKGRMKRFIAVHQNQTNTAYQACNLPDGTKGSCRHLRHCIQEDFKTDFQKFLEHICIINNQYLGSCCQGEMRRGGLEGLAGDLPAIAPNEEQDEAALKTIRAENRGCGLSTRRQLRGGAGPANPREWPWMASVGPKYMVAPKKCGGVLITEQHVLTAAHCVHEDKPEELLVRLGEYDFKRVNDSRSHTFEVVEIRVHEFFDNANHRNDIAILKLQRSATLNTYIWPICLPPSDLQLDNKDAVLIGWGTTSFGGPTTAVLQEVSLPVWDEKSCIDAHVNTIFNESLCAGGRDVGKDACQYDSGGPLMYQVPSGRWTAIGVVSWGMRCGEPNHPGVYLRVDRYLQWIQQNTPI